MKERVLKFKNYLLKGDNIKEAALKAEINYKSTHSIIRRNNLKVINKGIRIKSNSDYFNIIDTQEKAYILGFFIADGYIEKNSNRICFNNSIDDLEIIEKIRAEIAPNSKLYYSNKQTGVIKRKEQVILRFTNKTISELLLSKYNITNAKTFNEEYKFDFNQLSQELISHFIRGYFDGDGSVSYNPKVENKQLFFNFSFIFNSKLFSEQFGDIFKDRFNIIPVIYTIEGKTCNYYTLRFNYNRNRQFKIREIYNWFVL